MEAVEASVSDGVHHADSHTHHQDRLHAHVQSCSPCAHAQSCAHAQLARASQPLAKKVAKAAKAAEARANFRSRVPRC